MPFEKIQKNKFKKYFYVTIYFLVSAISVWASNSNNTSNFIVEKKSPLLPVKYKSKSEAERNQKLQMQRLKRDIDKYKKQINLILQKYKDNYQDKFELIDYMAEYTVVDSLNDSNYVSMQAKEAICSVRFIYEDYDKWFVKVTITFKKLPEKELIKKLENDIALSILNKSAYNSYSNKK